MRTKKLFLILALLCAFAQGAHAQNYDVWDGHSEQQPRISGYWVNIDNAANLAYVRNHWNDIASGENPYYKMGLYLWADLDMSAASWTPLGFNDHNYEGTLDGNGHTIKIRIEGGDDNGRALFDEIGEYATVKNLHVDGYINVGDAAYVAGIVSDNDGLIENCWVSANITSNHYDLSNDADLGGIAGQNSGLIRYCCMTGNVTNTAGNSGVGGLVGRNNGRDYMRYLTTQLHEGIYHCTFYGSVSVDHAQDSKYVGQNNGSTHYQYDAFNQTEYDSASGNDMYLRAIKYPYSVTVNTVGPGSIQTAAGGEYDVPGTYPDATFTLHVRSGQVARVTITDADGNDIPLQGQAHDGSSYWFVMRNKNITATIVFYEDWPTQGTGTEEDPYRISSADDWNKFAHNVTYGRSYSGKYVKLTNDISVTTMAGGYQDDDNYQPFSGTFDGDGHTLTLNVNNQSRFAAPFKCVSGATIKNLRTAGTIDGTGNTDGKLLAGIIGVSFGNTTITRCRSSVTLTTDFGQDAALAGLVAGTKGGSLTIEGCVFDGSMTGSSNTRCAGIAGFEYTATTTTISDCLFVPATLTISTADDSYTKTFSRDPDATITGCYYTQPLGAAQGTAGYFGNINVPNTLGDLVTDYGVVKAYANGLFFNGKYYYSDAGSLSDPYIIDSEDVLARIAPIVNSGVFDFVGKHFSLTCDLDLSGRNWTPIGTTDRPFRGNFNGNNHTISNLTVNNPSGDYNGLFGWVEGYIDGPNYWFSGCDYIKNFVVKNANVRGRYYTGGVAGRVHGQLDFENVILDGATVQGASFTSGFIGSAEGDYDAIGTLEGYSELHVHNCLFVNGSVTENTSHDNYDFVDEERNSYVIFGNIERHSVFYNNYFSDVTYNGAAAPEDHYNVQAYPVTFDVPSGVNCDINTSSAAFYDNAYYYANKGTVNFNLSYKDLGRKVTSVKINSVEAGTASGQYSFTIDVSQTQSYAVTIVSATTGSTGSGDSAEDPILITSTEVWDLFAENVNKGINYSGKYLKLGADISVSTMVGTSVNKFSGTFDGNRDHYTLTFTKGSPESPFNEEYCAPFRFANNATFKNLKVAGDIYTSQKFAAGIVGWCNGTINITNCRVGIVIHSSKEGDGTHGGLVAMPQSIQMYGYTSNSTVNIADCVFEGRFFTTNGTTSCAGFVGWHNSQRVVITNSIFAPNPAIAAGEGETSINDGATFIRGAGAGTGCYYTVAMGDAQGTRAYAAAPDGIISKQQTLVDGNSYYLPCTVTTPRKYYRYTGEEISVIIPAVSAPYGATLTEGTDYTYAINPNPVMEKGEYTVTLTGQGTCTGAWSFTFTVLDLIPVTSETTVLEENLTYKVNEDVTIASRITVKGKVILILGEGTTLTAPKGIELSSSNNADLTIEGPGALTIDNSDYWKAGIGAYSVGTLTINGGVINVKGGPRAAGIGGDSNNSNGGVITINGGVVNATGGEVAAGIGGGSDGENGNYGVCGAITINGGQVTATGNQAPGIGPGFEYTERDASTNMPVNLYYNSGTLTLGWSSPSDFVYNNGLKNNGGSTLESITFAEGKKFVIEGTAIMATASNIGGKKIVPFNMPTFSGAGTEEEPYLIRNADEWVALCVDVSGGNSYSGKFVKLTDDISVTHKMGVVSGSTQVNAFSGTFDGDGHTITATISDNDSQGTALFCYINGATIKNLTVAGTISSNQSHTSGLVGFAAGTNRIEGCTVIATLNIGKDYAGGIIGHGLTSSTTISSCVFAGTVVGNGGSRSNIGGIWGWSDSAAPVLVNCLEKGTYTSITSMHPMGLQNGSGTITNCYYMNPQVSTPTNACTVSGAKRAYAFTTAPANLGELVKDYGTIKVYPHGILYNGTYYMAFVTKSLADNSDNSTTISKADGYLADVTLSGRTLYKDGKWNTLCLPFSLNNFTGTPLEGATVKTLESTSFSGGTLTMTFSEDVTTIEAGKPYIVKWANGTDIENPVFNGVTISNAAANAETDYVDFVGTYSPVSIYTDEKTNLYLGADNTLYYPTEPNFQVNAFRGYFQLKGLTAGEPSNSNQASVRAFKLNFGDDEATGIISVHDSGFMVNGSDAWYTIDGRKLDGKPIRAGVYINNGKKVAIK